MEVAQHSLFVETSNWFEPLAWDKWFPAGGLVEVDLGAGDGGFIVERARRHPEINFVAVERLLGRARKIDRKGRRLGLSNLRVLRMETHYCMERLFPARSLRAIYLLFPDPWPKKKHQQRRIIRGPFLEAMERVLEPGGTFYAATDHEEYFGEIREAFANRPGWSPQETAPADWFDEQTDFEIEFLSERKKIHRLAARWKSAACGSAP